MVFCNAVTKSLTSFITLVTILILIDGFLQFNLLGYHSIYDQRHNPYFNRWFSAILLLSFLMLGMLSHNPYFNRWFSAMNSVGWMCCMLGIVTILILIDGFLQ